MLTNNIERLEIGHGQYTLMLNDKGGVIDDLIAYRTGENEFFLVVNASMIDQDFDQASQKAYLVGAAYDFSKVLVEGLRADVNFAWGQDAINPKTRAKAPNQAEYDTTIDYRPSLRAPFFLKGLWFRVRADILDQQDAPKLGYQFRLILNWDRDLI